MPSPGLIFFGLFGISEVDKSEHKVRPYNNLFIFVTIQAKSSPSAEKRRRIETLSYQGIRKIFEKSADSSDGVYSKTSDMDHRP